MPEATVEHALSKVLEQPSQRAALPGAALRAQPRIDAGVRCAAVTPLLPAGGG